MATQWLINDWFPIGHKGLDTAPEGSLKTIFFTCYCSVCIASGNDVLGHNVQQGSVLIVDEETPESSLDSHLDRFSQGLGYKTWRDLPITLLSQEGFRFNRKTELDKILSIMSKLKPKYVRFDSLIAMAPGGRQNLTENDSNVGVAIRDDLNKTLKSYPYCSTSLSAHSKKYVAELLKGDLEKSDMVSLVRGHGSIVGEGCDTGFIIKKISEYPSPTRFAIITKPRRQAIPMATRTVYVEMEEQKYGEGWARLKEISPVILPPSKLAEDLFLLFLDGNPNSAKEIIATYALFTRQQCRVGILELLEHNVITECPTPQTYVLNVLWKQQCSPAYVAALEQRRIKRDGF